MTAPVLRLVAPAQPTPATSFAPDPDAAHAAFRDGFDDVAHGHADALHETQTRLTAYLIGMRLALASGMAPDGSTTDRAEMLLADLSWALRGTDTDDGAATARELYRRWSAEIQYAAVTS